MVRYLRQFEYMLLQRLPQQHRRLADTLALDHIEPLRDLFRSLILELEACVEEQGYNEDLANRVLEWLSKDDELHVKVSSLT